MLISYVHIDLNNVIFKLMRKEVGRNYIYVCAMEEIQQDYVEAYQY